LPVPNRWLAKLEPMRRLLWWPLRGQCFARRYKGKALQQHTTGISFVVIGLNPTTHGHELLDGHAAPVHAATHSPTGPPERGVDGLRGRSFVITTKEAAAYKAVVRW